MDDIWSRIRRQIHHWTSGATNARINRLCKSTKTGFHILYSDKVPCTVTGQCDDLFIISRSIIILQRRIRHLHTIHENIVTQRTSGRHIKGEVRHPWLLHARIRYIDHSRHTNPSWPTMRLTVVRESSFVTNHKVKCCTLTKKATIPWIRTCQCIRSRGVRHNTRPYKMYGISHKHINRVREEFKILYFNRMAGGTLSHFHIWYQTRTSAWWNYNTLRSTAGTQLDELNSNICVASITDDHGAVCSIAICVCR